MLARQQRVDAHSGPRGDLLEAVPLDFVRGKYLPLLLWQFIEGLLQLVQQNGSRIGFRGPGIRRWQQVYQPQRLSLVGERHRIVSPRPQPLLAKEIDDAIARHSVHPGAPLLHGLHQAECRDDFEEDLLKQIFRVGLVGHPLANEIAQPGAFSRDQFRDLTVLLGHRDDARRFIHPLLKTNGARKYCSDWNRRNGGGLRATGTSAATPTNWTAASGNRVVVK